MNNEMSIAILSNMFIDNHAHPSELYCGGTYTKPELSENAGFFCGMCGRSIKLCGLDHVVAPHYSRRVGKILIDATDYDNE